MPKRGEIDVPVSSVRCIINGKETIASVYVLDTERIGLTILEDLGYEVNPVTGKFEEHTITVWKHL